MARKRSKPKKKTAMAQKTKKQRIIALVVVAIAFLAILIAANSGETPAKTNSLPADINTAMGHQKFEDGAFLLDVRTREEWVEFHIDGATLIPLDELEVRAGEVPTDQEVIVICNSGNRSTVGRDILLSAGHGSVSSITGGIQGWMSAGYDVVSGE